MRLASKKLSERAAEARFLWWSLGILLFCFAVGHSLMKQRSAPAGLSELNKSTIAAALEEQIRTGHFPEKIDLTVRGQKIKAGTHYTINSDLQQSIQKLFESYRPDYAAAVVIHAPTGRVLALASYTREHEKLGNLALTAVFPAASVFKIVTATAALDSGVLRSDTVIPFNGSYHTLYRRNVFSTQQNRWTRNITLREAFAKSVNTVFGKIGMFHLAPQQLDSYARRFQFNQPIPSDVKIDPGKFMIAEESEWALAEAASGFNRVAIMSPFQGALMAASIAQDGVMMEPYLVDSLTDEAGAVIYRAEPGQLALTMGIDAAAEMRQLMKETISSGTSRKAFRDLTRRRTYSDVEFGGKTGSLNSRNPDGKCDWFVGYARREDDRVAVAILTVHRELWRVKSSYLGRSILEKYFK